MEYLKDIYNWVLDKVDEYSDEEIDFAIDCVWLVIETYAFVQVVWVVTILTSK